MVPMLEQLASESTYGSLFTMPMFTKDIWSLYTSDLKSRICILAIDEDENVKGFATFEIMGWPNLDIPIKMARESFIYIKPEFRRTRVVKELLDSFEHWSKSVGATHCLIGTNSDMTKFGYTKREVIYMKEIK